MQACPDEQKFKRVNQKLCDFAEISIALFFDTIPHRHPLVQAAFRGGCRM